MPDNLAYDLLSRVRESLAEKRTHRIARRAAEDYVRCDGIPTGAPDEYWFPDEALMSDEFSRDCIEFLCAFGAAEMRETYSGSVIVRFIEE